MTEAEWLACEYPAPMLIYLRGQVSPEERSESRASLHSSEGVLYPGPSPIASASRFTSFVAACASRLRQLALDEQTHRYLETFLLHLDGQATLDELRAYGNTLHTTRVKGQWSAGDYLTLGPAVDPYGAGMVCWSIECAYAWEVARDSIAITCVGATEEDWFEWSFSGGPPDPLYQATRKAESRHQANLLQEVFGNPFRAIPLRTACQTPTVLALAQAAYDERAPSSGELDPARLAILADALEDAGCMDAALLAHLRSPGPHVRGCWALNLLLNKP